MDLFRMAVGGNVWWLGVLGCIQWCSVVLVKQRWHGADSRAPSHLHGAPTNQAHGFHGLSCNMMLDFPCGVICQEDKWPLTRKPWPQNFNGGIMNEDQNCPKGSLKWFQPFWEHFLFICEDLDEIKAFDTGEPQKMTERAEAWFTRKH